MEVTFLQTQGVSRIAALHPGYRQPGLAPRNPVQIDMVMALT